MALRAAPPTVRISLADHSPIPDAFRAGAIAIGSFDGVHRGHQALLGLAVELGEEVGGPPIAMTFEPHPRALLAPDTLPLRLSSLEARRRLLGLAGAEGVVEIEFDRDLASLSAEDFVQKMLVERLAARAVTVGSGFRFGYRRTGDTELLARLGGENGFKVRTLATVVDDDGNVVSSGRVRDAILRGDLKEANEVLGYRWFVAGKVVAGDRRGRELGYPTANLDIDRPIGLPYGIYAVTAGWDDVRPVPAVASYGLRPTFGGGKPLLEVHVFDRNDDLYDKTVTVSFLARIRAEERFDTAAALIRQMDGDSKAARRLVDEAGAGSKLDRALAVRD